MRKYMWYAAMVALLAAGAIFLAADYANRYPASTLGRCVAGVYCAGTNHNPIYRLARFSFFQGFGLMHKAASFSHATPPQANAAPETPSGLVVADPVPVAPDAAHDLNMRPDPEQPQGQGAIVPPQMLGKIVIPAEADEPAAPVEPQPMPPHDLCKAAPALMPHADQEPSPPARMPYADEEPRAAHTAFEFWMGLIDRKSVEPVSHEECEPAANGPGDCREDPGCGQEHPGCPHMNSSPCPGATMPEHKEMRPTFGGAESSEPELQEVQKIEERNYEPSGPAGAHPGHKDVDTTEFRPSDAHPGEFAPKPY